MRLTGRWWGLKNLSFLQMSSTCIQHGPYCKSDRRKASQHGVHTPSHSKRRPLGLCLALPATVHVRVGGVDLRSVLHRRRLRHNVSFPISGAELLTGIHVAASPQLESVEIARIDERQCLGKIMIVSPHPDDAELGAGGLYMDHCCDVSIVTLAAGDWINKMTSQYVKRLDNNLADASTHKATIRAWNSVHTPSLGGVPVERCVNLGLPDLHLMHIATEQTPTVADAKKKSICRSFNQVPLPGDRDGAITRTGTIGDLCHLIESWRPTTLVLMDPEIDVHTDHRACSLLVADALERSAHQPTTVLLCSIHHRHRLFRIPAMPSMPGTPHAMPTATSTSSPTSRITFTC